LRFSVLLCVASCAAVSASAQTVEYTYDDLGRLVVVKDDRGTGSASDDITTIYEFDKLGNRESVMVTGAPAGGGGTGQITLQLVNATSDNIVRPLSVDDTIYHVTDLNEGEYSLLATYSGSGSIGSIEFARGNTSITPIVDDSAPFTLFNTNGSNYFGQTLWTGTRTYIVTAYSGANATGQPLAQQMFVLDTDHSAGGGGGNNGDFNESAISLKLVNAQTDAVSSLSLQDGDTIDLSSDLNGQQYSLDAAYNGSGSIGSIQFFEDGTLEQNENHGVYARFGNSGSDYNGGNLPIGQFVVTIKVFDSPSGNGTPLAQRTYTLTGVN